jgi:hypothetical protein
MEWIPVVEHLLADVDLNIAERSRLLGYLPQHFAAEGGKINTMALLILDGRTFWFQSTKQFSRESLKCSRNLKAARNGSHFSREFHKLDRTLVTDLEQLSYITQLGPALKCILLSDSRFDVNPIDQPLFWGILRLNWCSKTLITYSWSKNRKVLKEIEV